MEAANGGSEMSVNVAMCGFEMEWMAAQARCNPLGAHDTRSLRGQSASVDEFDDLSWRSCSNEFEASMSKTLEESSYLSGSPTAL